MWNEMCDRLHCPRSMKERLRYENDEVIIFDRYTQRIIDDQEIYDNEGLIIKDKDRVEC